LKSGETIGCFYVESPAMRGLLKKFRCEDYLTLVAASSIIRPGVAKSGMMKEYIFRFHNPDKFKYLHPIMEKQLGETYGVMVYQEDVLKICHHYADLDLADADVLRRAMSGKHRSKNEFQRIIEKFFENAKKLGRPENITKEVWRQIESFAGYSFSKAHSASFAVESFQSLVP
jgi:DNA polymerase III alpha subunit